jgi:chromosome partitioning protein
MRTIAVLAQKGGTGKTTLAAHLAVEAEKTGPKPVVVIDTDPQGSLTSWYQRRAAEQPTLISPGRRPLAEALRICADQNVGLAIVDSAPHAAKSALTAAQAADLVLIPTRPGVFDIEAIGATIDIADQADKPVAIVINATRPRGPITDEARQALESYGKPVCPTAIVQRAALADALIDGRAIQELDPTGKAAAEIAAVWRWIKRRM